MQSTRQPPGALGARCLRRRPAGPPGPGRCALTADNSAVGEPALWGFGGALALGIILIAAFLAMIVWNGMTTFWPKPLVQVELRDRTVLAGEPSRFSTYRPAQNVLAALTQPELDFVAANGGFSDRTLYRTANFDLTGNDFTWVSDFQVATTARPADFFYFERQEWGPFAGGIAGLIVNDQPLPADQVTFARVRAAQRDARGRFDAIRAIERGGISSVTYRIERERLARR